MTNPHREQLPLLCDDHSDEEFDVKNYSYHRRNRHPVRSGRARNYAKGAAAVITRWPDNCSSSVAYWWLGVSMIGITVFVIYNSVLIFGMIPTSDMKQPKYRIFSDEIKSKGKTLSVPDVYMHLIINNSTDVPLNKYLPYAKAIAKRYPSFKYKFLVVLNDTLKDFHEYNDEERNEVALNSLWTHEKLSKKISIKYNISTQYISLTAYLNDSPIKKFWRHLPPHLIEFLVRSVSIWEKGGIAFNPKILIPNLYNPSYIEKLYDIFNIYINTSIKSAERKINEKTSTRRPNNIQDIINDLVKDNNSVSNFDLSEAENKDIAVVSRTENILKFKRDLKHNSETDSINKINLKESNNHLNSDMNLNENNNILSNSKNSTEGVVNVLPLFLKYLFDNNFKKIANKPDVIHLEKSDSNITVLDSLFSFNQSQSLPVSNILKPSVEREENKGTVKNLKNSSIPIPVGNFPRWKINNYDSVPELSMDIKGNIIASKTACHAFLGTMFSNVIQHGEEETLTDFIISELSLFCNGLLTSCAGVNVILV